MMRFTGRRSKAAGVAATAAVAAGALVLWGAGGSTPHSAMKASLAGSDTVCSPAGPLPITVGGILPAPGDCPGPPGAIAPPAPPTISPTATSTATPSTQATQQPAPPALPVPPGTGSQQQGNCLNDEPAGAVPAGGGWISNTTQPVAQRNKTTTPPGGPDVRPAEATACLTTSLGTGSLASGDITGWQDAQLYVAANAPGVIIARCHLIANALGGKGQVRDGGQANLVPCWQVGMNTGTPSMRTYEMQVQKALSPVNLGPGDAVYYQVSPNYTDATSTIPQGVTMSATVERADGTTEPLFSDITIPNTRGGLNLGN